MAEGAADVKPVQRRKDAYNPPKKPSFRITRRGILQGAGVIAAGTALAAVTAPFIISNPEAPKPEPKTPYEILIEKGIVPEEIYIGDIKVTKKLGDVPLNVRSATNLDTSLITIWDNIEKFNGVRIKDVDEFTIKNTVLVEGADPGDPTGKLGAKGLWIPGFIGEEAKYISYSSATGLLVRPLGGVFEKVAEFSKAGLKTEKGEVFKPNQIGLVTPIPKAA